MGGSSYKRFKKNSKTVLYFYNKMGYRHVTASDKIIEWISYNNLQNIEYLTKGGIFEIYTVN